ncbi:hypothetical protein ALP75_203888 [Pseudomonas syringae pv. actinidiae]|nr:hypothetical protein ALP75_203888 [Pseudomonas syringae pv. actinidiae]
MKQQIGFATVQAQLIYRVVQALQRLLQITQAVGQAQAAVDTVPGLWADVLDMWLGQVVGHRVGF